MKAVAPVKPDPALKKIPVILDTDIGIDIDDVWALVMLLKSPEVDIKLITTDTGNTHYRATLVAKLLEIAGRTDIPVGVGIPLLHQEENHAEWLGDYVLDDYPGSVIEDGVGALINTIIRSPEPITLICIGPVPNIASALQREPRIVENCRFVGMHGSIRLGYGGALEPDPEFNVAQAIESCKKVFSAAWPMTITPIDTCGLIDLDGENYQAILQSSDLLVKSLVDLYRIWRKNIDWPHVASLDPDIGSSTLFDCVAIYLAFAEEYLNLETLGIRITDEGRTVIDDQAKQIRCATSWKDQDAFERFLTERLLELT